jgi:hypothetical protein
MRQLQFPFLDEKLVVLHQEIRPPLAMKPGCVGRRDGEYKRWRHGQRVLRRGAEGRAAFPKVTASRSAPEFADHLLDIATRYPQADTIHLVMANLGSHTRKLADRYTPKHGSPLNQAEIAISLFSRQCLGKRRIGDRVSLHKETRAWTRRMNHDRVSMEWKFTRKHARQKFGPTIMPSPY